MSYITSIGTANPPHKFSQQQIADFMIKAMDLSENEAKQLNILYRASGIETRYSILEDYGNHKPFSFYSNENNFEPFPSTKDRLDVFRKSSIEVSQQAAQNCLQDLPHISPSDITHLIVVSCTGMYAPGLDIELVHALKLNSTVKRTSINFMGCYAAFNAMRVADSFCSKDTNAKILIVCTELCSIHFQKENTDDNKLANALFADGSAALMMESKPGRNISLKIGNSFCDLASNGEKEMAWAIGDLGFEMKLSTYVPEAIKDGIKKLTNSLLSINKRALPDISFFAIHPGGKKILEAIESELGLTKSDNKFSYRVMKRYGNMSSPTVLFVLKEIISTPSASDRNKKILSFGFGPGLTLEGLILSVEIGK